MPSTIKKQRGPAGQVSFTAQTEDGPLTFTGSTYGGPIVMTLPSGAQAYVTDSGRFADSSVADQALSETWVQNFLAGAAV